LLHCVAETPRLALRKPFSDHNIVNFIGYGLSPRRGALDRRVLFDKQRLFELRDPPEWQLLSSPAGSCIRT